VGELRALIDGVPDEASLAIAYEGESFPVVEADVTTDPGSYASDLTETEGPVLVMVVTD
jgi:hypothetical protein